MQKCSTKDLIANSPVHVQIYNVDTGEVEERNMDIEKLIERLDEIVEKYLKIGKYSVLGEFFNGIIWTFRVSTAATDGIRLYFNPLFANNLLSLAGPDALNKQKELMKQGAKPSVIKETLLFESSKYFLFVIIHECYHQLYRHIESSKYKEETRVGGPAIQRLANISMDDEINRDIEIQFPEFAGATKASDGCIEAEKYPIEIWSEIFDDKFKSGETVIPPPPINPPQGPGNGGNDDDDDDDSDTVHKVAPQDYADGWAQAIADIKSGKVDPHKFKPLPVNKNNFDHEVLGYVSGTTEFFIDNAIEMMLAFNQDEWNQGYNDCIAKALQSGGGSSGGQQGIKTTFDNLDEPPKVNPQNGGGSGKGGDGKSSDNNQQSGDKSGNDKKQNGKSGKNQNGNDSDNGSNSSGNQQSGESENDSKQNGNSGNSQGGSDSDSGQEQQGNQKGGAGKGGQNNQQQQNQDRSQGGSGSGSEDGNKQNGKQNGQDGDGAGEEQDGSDGSSSQNGQQQSQSQGNNGQQQSQGQQGGKKMNQRSELGDGENGSRSNEEGNSGDSVYQVSLGSKWGVGDLISKSEGQKISEEEGQPFTEEEENMSPEEHAKQVIKHNESKIKDIGKGTMCPMDRKLAKINEILSPSVVNWKNLLSKLFKNAGIKEQPIMKIKKSRFGIERADRYELVNPKKDVERTRNSADVFYLVDASGSIGKRELYRTFSEVIALESRSDMNIKKSAFTYFADDFDENRIRVWYKEDSKKKKMELIQYVDGLDVGGGTEIAGSVVHVTKLKRQFYSPNNPKTLIIVFTDGVDYSFDKLKTLPERIIKNLVFIIMNKPGDGWGFDDIIPRLLSAGVVEKNIVCIDISKDLY